MPARHRAALLLAAAALVAGCTGAATSASPPKGAAAASATQPISHRPAAKSTCVAPRLTRLPDGVELHDRELVPLSPTLLSVENTFDDGNGRAIIVIAGGYLDDVLEAHDDLETIDRRWIDGTRMTVLGGRFLDNIVHAAYWRDTQPPPCDMRVIIATNLTVETFLRVLSGVR